MKLVKLPLAAAFVFSANAYAEVPLTEYKEATSAYEDAYLNGTLNVNDGNQDQTSYDLDLSADYERVFSSQDRNIKLDFSGSTQRSRGGDDDDKSTNFYQANGSATADNYFNPSANDSFWYGKGDIGMRKGQEDPFVSATVGVGYGRVVNATPMAKANRLIEALLERGLLPGQPSEAAYYQVARIIDKENAYRSKYGGADYEQMWIQDIENALGADLDARGIIKAYDVLDSERITTRKYGWLVRAGVGAVLSNYNGEDNGDPLLEVGAEYHYPINNRTQFSNVALLNTVLDDDDGSYSVTNDMLLSYEFSDRIDWINTWSLGYVDNENTNDITSNTISSIFRYYISNVISVDVKATLADLEDDIDNNGNDELEKSLTVGLNYRLK